MRKKIFLSVVIPCYNEEANLQRGVLQEVADYLTKQKYSWEVIISDDGSTDQSKKLVKDFIKKNPGFKLLINSHQGKPFALKSGLLRAAGQYTLITDMDQSAPINQYAQLLPWFKKGYQIVIGSRGRRRPNFPLYRQLASSVFRWLRQIFILKELVDTQCGFKAFNTVAAKKIFSRMTIFQQKGSVEGWRVTAYDVEFLFLAKKMGYQIKEVVVAWQDMNVGRREVSAFFKESIEMAKEVVRVKLNDLKGVYD